MISSEHRKILNLLSLCMNFYETLANSQAPDVPGMTHQSMFQLSRLSLKWYVQTMKKYPLTFLNHNNFMKIFVKSYTLDLSLISLTIKRITFLVQIL